MNKMIRMGVLLSGILLSSQVVAGIVFDDERETQQNPFTGKKFSENITCGCCGAPYPARTTYTCEVKGTNDSGRSVDGQNWDSDGLIEDRKGGIVVERIVKRYQMGFPRYFFVIATICFTNFCIKLNKFIYGSPVDNFQWKEERVESE